MTIIDFCHNHLVKVLNELYALVNIKIQMYYKGKPVGKGVK